MKLIRKHKISLISEIPLTGRDKEIIDLLEYSFSGLVQFRIEDDPDSIYYMKDDKLILEYINEHYDIWCRYDDLFEVLENKYKVEYVDIQTIIKYMIERHLKITTVCEIIPIDVICRKIERYYREYKEKQTLWERFRNILPIY